MKKFTLLLCAASLLLVGISATAKPRLIETRIDFSEGNYPGSRDSNQGPVAIGQINVNRTQPAESGPAVTLDPVNGTRQIGAYRVHSTDYLIVLDNLTVESFARDAVELALTHAGYTVVANGSGAPSVDINVDELWMWVKPMPEKPSRKQFYFRMTTTLHSDDPKLNGIGTISVTDFRNGSRDSNWKSYRNTIMHSMKAYLASFVAALDSAPTSSAPTETSALLKSQLDELETLRDDGTITDDEYTRLRSEALEKAL